jgi:hypothetical protein
MPLGLRMASVPATGSGRVMEEGQQLEGSQLVQGGVQGLGWQPCRSLAGWYQQCMGPGAAGEPCICREWGRT